MYHIYLVSNTVQEIIPDANPAFPDIPIEQRYSAEFISQCITADDVSGIHTGMIYDPDTKMFSEPPVPEPVAVTPSEPITPTPTIEEKNRADIDYLAVMTGVAL